jgi:acyl-coenzyme A synthetase/AMP-(fatty) acid ligase
LKNELFPSLKGIVRFNIKDERIKGFINFKDLFGQSNSSLLPDKISFQDPANIQFTSGTTGVPKAAVLSHYNIVNNAYLIG